MMFDLDQADANFAASADVVPVNVDPDPTLFLTTPFVCRSPRRDL
jgi:hypothetical protein